MPTLSTWNKYIPRTQGYIRLSEAIEEAGKAMFPDEWTGDERSMRGTFRRQVGDSFIYKLPEYRSTAEKAAVLVRFEARLAAKLRKLSIVSGETLPEWIAAYHTKREELAAEFEERAQMKKAETVVKAKRARSHVRPSPKVEGGSRMAVRTKRDNDFETTNALAGLRGEARRAVLELTRLTTAAPDLTSDELTVIEHGVPELKHARDTAVRRKIVEDTCRDILWGGTVTGYTLSDGEAEAFPSSKFGLPSGMAAIQDGTCGGVHKCEIFGRCQLVLLKSGELAAAAVSKRPESTPNAGRPKGTGKWDPLDARTLEFIAPLVDEKGVSVKEALNCALEDESLADAYRGAGEEPSTQKGIDRIYRRITEKRRLKRPRPRQTQ